VRQRSLDGREIPILVYLREMPPRQMQTLPGRDYHAAGVFELERERVFARSWFYAGRDEGLDEPGDFVSVDVAGESVIVVRTKEGALRGFYNVCRHRGSRLCDEGSGRMKGAIKCPYHAWAYSFDGRLIGTPNVGKDEVDRDSLGLWPIEVAVWQGFLFVHLDPDPVPLEEALADQDFSALPLARFDLAALRIGHRTVTEVQANWKILIDNYNECLHARPCTPSWSRSCPPSAPARRTMQSGTTAAWRWPAAATASPPPGARTCRRCPDSAPRTSRRCTA
jgi:Rieske 2Fe-2S family protein